MAKFEQRLENNGKHIDSHRYDQMSVADKQIVQRTRKESQLKDLPIFIWPQIRLEHYKWNILSVISSFTLAITRVI